MRHRRVRWIFYSVLPLALLLIPFTTSFNLLSPFRTITLQPQKTGITTLSYHDHSRNRPLVTEVWYPVDAHAPASAPTGFWARCQEARDAPIAHRAKKYPLILMSHGFGADRYNLAWLAETLAANGYIVAATDHYGNTWNNKIPELHVQPWERPKDISFVLDQLLIDSRFQEHIDTKKIGFIGYSLGGATGIWLAGAEASLPNKDLITQYALQDFGGTISPELIDATNFTPATYSYRDPRISAMLVMAPALGWLFTPQSLSQIPIPIMIIAPQEDKVVPVETNAKILAKKISRATLTLLPGETTHYVFLNRASVLGKRFLDPKYCTDAASVDRLQIHHTVARSSIKFFDAKLQ